MPAATYRLFVNLGASQTRKRLKGHGFGVKRVETAGNGRAVITHTATGRHLEELRALLSDVLEMDPAATSDSNRGSALQEEQGEM